MSISFRCSHILGRDPATGQDQRCNQLLKAADQLAGKRVRCPACSAITTVPQSGQSEKKRSSRDRSDDLSENPATELTPLPVPQSIMEQDFDETTSSIRNIQPGFGQDRCPSCGGLLNDGGFCSLCRFQDPRRRGRGAISARPAGFQLWLIGLVDTASTLRSLAFSVVLLSVVFLLILIVLGILWTSLAGVILAVGCGFLLVLLHAIVRRTRILARDPAAPLGVLAPAWNTVLRLSRWQNWQKYDSQLAGRLIIDLRGQDVSDGELAQIDSLEKCQVLDLEGCPIGDQALDCLYGHRHLQCLVVRKTSVSRKAVASLQQSLPRLWIWS